MSGTTGTGSRVAPEVPNGCPRRSRRTELLIKAQAALEKMEKEGNQLKDENKALQRRVKEVELAFEGKVKETEELERELGTEKEEMDKLKKEVEERKEKLCEVKTKLKGRTVQLELTGEELIKLKKELEEKEAQLENAAKEKSGFEKSAEALRNQIKVQKAKVKGLKQVIQNCVDLSQKNANQMLEIANGAGKKTGKVRTQPKPKPSTSDKLRQRLLATATSAKEPASCGSTGKRSRPASTLNPEAGATSSNPEAVKKTKSAPSSEIDPPTPDIKLIV